MARRKRNAPGSAPNEGPKGGREDMVKHKGFPGRMPSTDYQFTIRRANPKGVTPLIRRERYADRRAPDRAADLAFMAALWEYFGEEPFVRGNLDAGRLSWLLGREVVTVSDPFDPVSYDAELRIDRAKAEAAFPEVFDESWGMPPPAEDDDWDE